VQFYGQVVDLKLLDICVAGAPVRLAATKPTAEEIPKAKITPKQSVLLMDLLDANKHNGDLWDDAPLKPTASKKHAQPAQSTPVKAAPATATGPATATASVPAAAAAAAAAVSPPKPAASTSTPAPVHAPARVAEGQSVVPAAQDAAATAEAVGSVVPTRQETASADMSPVPTTAPATACSSAQPQTDDTTALLDSLPPVPIQPVRATVAPAASEGPAEEAEFVAKEAPVAL
jgi:hypothetical protein